MDALSLKDKYKQLSKALDERSFRLCLAGDALSIGYGGISRIAEAAGVSRTTIHTGISDLRQSLESTDPTNQKPADSIRIRRPGGGRHALCKKDQTLCNALDQLLDPVTRGDPMNPLRWTCKSTPKLAKELQNMGYDVSQTTVWRLLSELGYSMQSNRKTKDGGDHPDRNAQFEYISKCVQKFVAAGQPVISVDTKKKELIGNYKNGGQEWERSKTPKKVKMHDFADPDLGKAIPYGVYDLGRNEGWVSVGVTHDTAEFAVETIRRWWLRMGKKVYPAAKRILITADGGGSNGARVRLWKVELQNLANNLGMMLHVRHFPPGTSKWNKIEHRMFCHITENWRARPLNSLMTVVNLICNTSTAQGLSIKAEIDDQMYETGKKVEDNMFETLNITKCLFRGEWNYCVKPNKKSV